MGRYEIRGYQKGYEPDQSRIGIEVARNWIWLYAYDLDGLRRQGVQQVNGRVTTMSPGDIELAEKMGFAIKDWGYKVYYSYEMGWGKLNVSSETAVEINPEKDLDECVQLATRWYQRPFEPVYQKLGFEKAAEWARCEKALA